MTAALIPTPVMQFLDADGNPLVGGKVYTYAAGTSTPLATYTDYGGATPNANPVILNSRGEASIWFGTAAYKLELYTAANVLIWTADNVSASTPVVYGTGVAAALAINVGTAGSILVNGGVLGTPSSGLVTNLTGTASININGTVGATTANTGAFTTINASGLVAMAGAATVGTTLGVTGAATIQTLTVGLGAGAVATNTAVGVSALAANTTGSSSVAVGNGALIAQTSGDRNVAVGESALSTNITGVRNTAVGHVALAASTASYNTAFGGYALFANTTASNNTAVGYQAGYSNTTNGANAFFGGLAGYNSTGITNTYIGYGAGYSMTSGGKNVIIGGYNGNQGGLDIRTSSNNIVLSDGDGNPNANCTGGAWGFGIGTRNGDGVVLLNGFATAGYGPVTLGKTGALNSQTSVWSAGSRSFIAGGTNYSDYAVQAGTTNGVYVANGGTSWTSLSDERTKENLVPISDAITKVTSLRAVTGNYIADSNKTAKAFLIAQDVLNVLPEAVDSRDEEKLGLSYTDVIPLLVAAIKELNADFEAYKSSHP